MFDRHGWSFPPVVGPISPRQPLDRALWLDRIEDLRHAVRLRVISYSLPVS